MFRRRSKPPSKLPPPIDAGPADTPVAPILLRGDPRVWPTARIEAVLDAERVRRRRLVDAVDRCTLNDDGRTVMWRDHPSERGGIAFSTAAGIIEHVRFIAGSTTTPRTVSAIVIELDVALDEVVNIPSGGDPPLTRLEMLADEVRRHIEDLGWVAGSDVSVRVVHSTHA